MTRLTRARPLSSGVWGAEVFPTVVASALHNGAAVVHCISRNVQGRVTSSECDISRPVNEDHMAVTVSVRYLRCPAARSLCFCRSQSVLFNAGYTLRCVPWQGKMGRGGMSGLGSHRRGGNAGLSRNMTVRSVEPRAARFSISSYVLLKSAQTVWRFFFFFSNGLQTFPQKACVISDFC